MAEISLSTINHTAILTMCCEQATRARYCTAQLQYFPSIRWRNEILSGFVHDVVDECSIASMQRLSPEELHAHHTGLKEAPDF